MIVKLAKEHHYERMQACHPCITDKAPNVSRDELWAWLGEL